MRKGWGLRRKGGREREQGGVIEVSDGGRDERNDGRREEPWEGGGGEGGVE